MSVATVLEHDSLQVKSERMVDNEMEDGSSTRQVDTSHWPVEEQFISNARELNDDVGRHCAFGKPVHGS